MRTSQTLEVDSPRSCLTVELAYDKLRPFVRYLANHCQTYHPLMSPDELEGELNLEVVKGYRYYQGKVDDVDMVRLLKRVLHNRIHEIRRHYFRSNYVEMRSVDIDELYNQPTYDPQTYIEFTVSLTEAERKLVDDALAGQLVGRSGKLWRSVCRKWRENYGY